jgi:flagellar hook-associated protein 3 FlgL
MKGVLGNGQSANDGGLLDTLRTIANDMQSGNGSAVNADLSSLDTNLNSLGGLSASVGATQDRLQMAASRIQTLQASDTQVLSNTQDADMASTEISYSTQQAALTAALQAGASIVQKSLMDFLNG